MWSITQQQYYYNEARHTDCVDTWTCAAGRIGGDFIVRKSTQHTITAVLGDATGHGEVAAQIAAFVRPMIQRDVGTAQSSSLIQHWNRVVRRKLNKENRFVCLTMLQLDLRSRMLTILNCGNPDVLIRRANNGKVERFASTGMPLGIVDEHEWTPPVMQSTFLGMADYAFCFSDGVIDCLGEGGERYGLPRVCAAARYAFGPSPLQSLRQRLMRFQSPTAEQDDLSILVLGGRTRQVA